MEQEIPVKAFELLKSHGVKSFKCPDFEVEFYEQKEDFELPQIEKDEKPLTEEDILMYSTNEPLSIEREDHVNEH